MKRVLGTLLALLLCIPQIAFAQQFSNMQTHQQNPATTAAWTSATAADTFIFIDTAGLSVAGVSFNPSGGSITGGTVVFEGSRDGTNYLFTAPAIRTDGSFIADTSLALNGATLKNWRVDVRTFTQVRIRLSAQITGAGTANVALTGHAGAASESVVVGQADATKLKAQVELSQYTPASGRLPVDGSGVTQPISSTQLPSSLVSGRLDVSVGNNPVLGAGGNTIGGVNLPQYTPESGRLPVAVTSLPLPTGASTAAKQPALGTAGSASADVITVQGIASMTPLLTTLSGTNNINDISGNISLPTGAATSAKQPGLGTAGTASTDVITVQGIASMTPLSVTFPSAQSVSISGTPTVTANAGTGTFTFAGNKTNNNAAPGATNIGALIGIANTSAPSHTEGNQVGASFDLSGALRVTGLGGGGTSSNFGSAFPTPGTAIGFSDGTNMQGSRVVDFDTGGGTVFGLITNLVRRASGGPVELIGQATMANSIPVVLASDQSTLTVTANAGTNLNTSALLTTSAFNTVFGSASLILGTQADGLANTSDGLQVTSFDHIFNGSTFDRKRGVSNGLDSAGTGIQAVGLVGQLDDTSPSTVTENQFANVRITGTRDLRIHPRDGAGDSITEDAQNAMRAWLVNRLEDTQDSVALRDGSGNLIATATTTPGGSDRGLVVRVAGTLPAGTEFNIGDAHSATGAGRAALGIRRDTAAVPSGVADGDWTVPIFDSANRMHVAVGSFPANTGFNLSQVGGNTTVTGGVNGSLGVGGVAAHDASGTSINPMLIGGIASAAAPADVSADNDLVRGWFLRNGAQAIQPTFAGNLWSTGNGGVGAGVPRVTIANDSTGVIGLAAGSNLIGMTVPSATATTTNSLLTSYLSSAASTNSTNVKSSAGNVYSIVGINTTGTIYYLRMYNLSSAPTCSSATGFVNTYPVPANTSGNGFVIPIPQGQGFSTGIGFCLTGGAGSTDNTNAATGVFLTFLYK